MKSFFKKPKFKLILTTLFVFFLFFLIDIVLRYVMIKEFYGYHIYSFAPNLFTLGYIFLILGFFLFFKKRGKLILFNFISIFFLVIFVAQYFHFKILGRPFVLEDIFLAGDAAGFANFLSASMSAKFILSVVIFIILIVFINVLIIKFVKTPSLNIRKRMLVLLGSILVFIVFQIIAVLSLGEAYDDGLGVNATNPRNIYNSYDDSTKALLVSGLYKYAERNIYLFVKNEFFGESRSEMLEKINEYQKDNPYEHNENDMTGIFEGKSVLYVLLESMDSYLITEEDTPTLYKMQEEGFNFVNRYAPGFGGGLTFNSEFAMITGMYQPLKGTASTKYANNVYKYSYPSIFRDAGYISNSIHANESTFYNRNIIHKSFGFQNFYADLNTKYKDDFWYDSKLVSDEEVYDLLIPEDKKFANFLMTISPHGPYGESNTHCEGFIDKYPEYNKIEDKELACLKASAKETDKFFEELLNKLEEDDMLDDVVIIAATDHYVYGYSNTPQIKGTEDDAELSKVPLIIWNSEVKGKEVLQYTDTADILPTIANMFNINYTPKVSVGDDVFSEEHENYVYFSDGSFIMGGKHYKNDGSITDKKVTSIFKDIQEKIEINELLLDSDYYRK